MRGSGDGTTATKISMRPRLYTLPHSTPPTTNTNAMRRQRAMAAAASSHDRDGNPAEERPGARTHKQRRRHLWEGDSVPRSFPPRSATPRTALTRRSASSTPNATATPQVVVAPRVTSNAPPARRKDGKHHPGHTVGMPDVECPNETEKQKWEKKRKHTNHERTHPIHARAKPKADKRRHPSNVASPPLALPRYCAVRARRRCLCVSKREASASAGPTDEHGRSPKPVVCVETPRAALTPRGGLQFFCKGKGKSEGWTRGARRRALGALSRETEEGGARTNATIREEMRARVLGWWDVVRGMCVPHATEHRHPTPERGWISPILRGRRQGQQARVSFGVCRAS